MTTDDNDYEAQRIANINKNRELLASLGLDVPVVTTSKPKSKPQPKAKATPRKTPASLRKAAASKSGSTPATPVKEGSEAGSEGSTLRRSARSSGRKVDYTHEALEKASQETPSHKSYKRSKVETDDDDEYSGDDEDYRQRKAQKLGIRTQDPKTFGHIPGVQVGQWFPSRMDASTAAIHAPTVAGISGNAIDGAYSVALSGGYPDDVDLGEAFTYTGSGGRDLKGTKQNPKNLRTAPQSSHQSFDNPMNAALKKSAETRKPVRVIRGFKLDSAYAPLTGYRYDGLYVVERTWMDKGLTKGLMVCRYAFKRMAGQPPLLLRENEQEGEGEGEGEGDTKE